MKKIELLTSKIKTNNLSKKYDKRNDLNASLTQLLMQEEVDMKKIQEKVVPIVKECDVFISYSHSDDGIARFVANELMAEGYKVFVDSLFWGSIDKCLKIYDDKIRGDNKTYNYYDRNKSTSTFHMILVDSIIDTIRNCKVFLFLKGNEIEKSKTLSPWLYLENKIANDFKNELPPMKKQLTEDSNFTVKFPITTNDFFVTDTLERLKFLLEKSK